MIDDKKEGLLRQIVATKGDKCFLLAINQLTGMSELFSGRLMGNPNKSQIIDKMADLRVILEIVMASLGADNNEIEEKMALIYEELAESYKEEK